MYDVNDNEGKKWCRVTECGGEREEGRRDGREAEKRRKGDHLAILASCLQ